MNRLITFALSFLSVLPIVAQPSASYYNKVDGLKKADLKLALKNIIINHKQLTYGSELPAAYQSVYYIDGQPSMVYDLFSTETYEYSSSKWNKEHVIPKSWWGGTVNKAYSDIFSVIPSESGANTQKSNFPIGTVYRSKFDNGRIKVGTPVTGQGGSYTTVFEPADEFKGDFARIYFYVATCYSDIAWGSNSNVKSELVQEDWPTLKPWLYTLLLKWHNQDPVSEKEKQINNNAEKEQGNRNPFIDYPALADYIWGDYTATAFSLAEAKLYEHVVSGQIDPFEPNDTIEIINPVDTTGVLIVGETLLADTFDSASEGNDQETGGSSTQWSGDEWFPTVSNVFQAGGTLRLGSSKNTGSITSVNLNYAGGPMTVELTVKGWTSIEGTLLVRMGDETQTVNYAATINDAFERVRLVFHNVPKNPAITISTSAKRCYLGEITVKAASYQQPAVSQDVNGDGIIDTQDVLAVYQYIQNDSLPIEGTGSCDVNGDGIVDTQDVLAIYEAIRIQ